MSSIFFDIGIIIIVATVFAFLAKLMKQPIIPAYILTGLILGPWTGLITDVDTIHILSEIGISFLLFIVGLEINLKKLKNIGLAGTLGGTIQVVSLFSMGFIAAAVMGYLPIEAIYIGIILCFSSTMVVLKLLSDKTELDTLHGRIITGILLMQDVFAIFAISVLGKLDNFSALALFASFFNAFIIIAGALFASKHIFPKIFKFAARSGELLLLSALCLCFLFSLAFNYIGFSIAIGAFIAGVTLANLPYNIEIISKVRSLRDFFATIFFVSLGMEIMIVSAQKIIFPFILFLFIIIIIKPFIILFLTAYFGFKSRTSFYTGMSLGQISEFSLIIMAQGLKLGHVSQEMFSLTIILAITSIVLTSYYIKYDHIIFHKLAKRLKIFDRFTSADKEQDLDYLPKKKTDVILCGYNRVGYSIGRTIRRMKKSLLVVEFNPEIIKFLIRNKVACIYGDIGDIELIERLPLREAKMVISTVPDERDNKMLIKKAKHANADCVVYVTANQVDEALDLYDTGADYVILPHLLGGDHVSLLLEDFTQDVNKLIGNKLEHIKELHRRKNLHHDHPLRH